MANSEHLAKLKEGTAIWNQWRRDHPEVKPVLREADLSEASLCSAYLGLADLGGADLSDANLGRANLSGVDFFQTNLAQTNFFEANLAARGEMGSFQAATEIN